MNERVYIFVSGILERPSRPDGVTDRAVAWIRENTFDQARKLEYLAGVLTGRLLNWLRAVNLRRLCRRYGGDRIVLVGYSNGTDIICRALEQSCGAVDEVHLIAAACPASFARNGLNTAIAAGRVGTVHVYASRADGALAAAKRHTGWLRLVGADYGWLGLDGPQDVADENSPWLDVYRKDAFGHGTWFEPAQFGITMRLITGNRALRQRATGGNARAEGGNLKPECGSRPSALGPRPSAAGQSLAEYAAVLAFVVVLTAAVLTWLRVAQDGPAATVRSVEGVLR